MKHTILTFGSGTQDMYILSDTFRFGSLPRSRKGKELCLAFGAKLEVEDIIFFTGGGGTNAACTFARQGCQVSWCGMIGKDHAGQFLKAELRRKGIGTRYMNVHPSCKTAHSVIFNSQGSDRTILVYRGAAEEMKVQDIPWKKMRSSWVYVAPLSGKLSKMTDAIARNVRLSRASCAVNPGNSQILSSRNALNRLVRSARIILLNDHEAELLSGKSVKNMRALFGALRRLGDGIWVVTKGSSGSIVCEGNNIYTAPALKAKVVDTTGAGDAFGSGFVSSFMEYGDIPKAIQFATANAASCITKRGAKEGLLSLTSSFQKVPVRHTRLSI